LKVYQSAKIDNKTATFTVQFTRRLTAALHIENNNIKGNITQQNIA